MEEKEEGFRRTREMCREHVKRAQFPSTHLFLAPAVQVNTNWQRMPFRLLIYAALLLDIFLSVSFAVDIGTKYGQSDITVLWSGIKGHGIRVTQCKADIA